jgi:hypothetical protein
LRVSVLYGPTAEEERHRIVAAFRNDPGPHIVLASEIAAEGLDFEFANVMVNYDLPWNPMRVEQRIGRLDRYGQRSRAIHIINFAVEDTIEERILDRLYTRIGIFEAAIGDLESILGDEIETLTRELLRPGLTADEEAAIIDQVAENIVRRKDESESFEQESQALLGQDDVFTEQLNRMERDQRFVGPDEIRNFVKVALKSRYPRIKVRDDDGTTTIGVPTDGAIRELLSNYLQKRVDRGGRKAWRSVGRAQPGSEWTITFDPETAKAQRDLDFVTLQHPLVGALLDGEPDVVLPTAALHVRSADVEPGSCLFFLYLLNIKSFRSGLEFFPVIIRPGQGVDEVASGRLLTLFRDASVTDQAAMRPDEDVVDAAWTAAEEWVSRQILERETELKLLSDQILDRRSSSLQDAFDRWVTHRRGQLAEAEYNRYESIARLHRGYIRRRESELAEKLRQLEAQRAVQIGYELVAGGILEVEALTS